MSLLSITLFGTVQASLNGQPVKFATEKCQALLAYLALESGRALRREGLATLLWPEQAERAARSNLRQTLHRLRKAIGDTGSPDPHLLVTARDIRLNPDGELWLDVGEFERCLEAYGAHCANGLPLCANCHEVLKRADALYGGRFMAGFSLSANPSFELWLLSKQEGYRHQTLEVLGRLGGFYEATADFGRAAACARRLVTLEPWREASHRLLMRSLERAGQRRAALAEYERCRQILAEDLGVEPSDETRKLYERMRDGRSSRGWRGEDGAAAGSRPEPRDHAQKRAGAPAPFVGRERALARLQGTLDQALAGQGRVLFIRGEAGSGKTSVAAEFCRRAMAAEESVLVSYGRCDGHFGLGDPYQPFRETLRLLSGQAGRDLDWIEAEKIPADRLQAARPAIMRALAEAGPDLPGTLLPDRSGRGSGGQGQGADKTKQDGVALTALFEQVTGFLRGVARSRPLILVLDDLHWIDAASASLLFHLGRHLANGRLLIVAAYRPEEVDWFDHGARETKRHPLLPIIHGLRRVQGDSQIDLDRADGRAFVEAYVDSEPNRLDEGFRNSLYHQTGGNPLFTVEMLRGLQYQEELVKDEAGCWVMGGKLAWDRLPARVEAVITERLERLTPSCQAITAAAGVQGQTFLAEVVATVEGMETGPVVRCLSEILGQQHHLVEAGSREHHNGRFVSRFRFRHHLFQQFAYQQLDDVTRSRLHEATGLALETLYADQSVEHAAELARHFAAAGWVEKAAGYLLIAGKRAYIISANEAAIAYFREGLALLATLPAAEDAAVIKRLAQQELTLLMALGASLRAGRGYAAAVVLDNYTRVRDLARQIGDTERQFMAQLLLWTSYLTQADYRRALDISLQLQSLAKNTRKKSQIAEANLALGMVRFYQGDFGLALEHLETTITNHTPQEQNLFLSPIGQNTGLTALTLSVRALWFLGYPDQALKRSQLAIAQTEALDHSYSLAVALGMAGCVVHLLRGEYLIVKDQSERLLRLALEEAFDFFAAWARIFQGRAQLFLGQRSEGLANLQQGLSACQEMDHYSNMTFGLALFAEAGSGDGQREEALQDALALDEYTGERFFAAELQRLRGEHLLQGGDEHAAEVCFKEALDIARRQEAKSLELRAAMSLARLQQGQGNGQEAYGILAEVVGWFTEGFGTADLREARRMLLEFGGEAGKQLTINESHQDGGAPRGNN